MSGAEIIALIATLNGLVIEGRRLAVTLDGEELSNDELDMLIDEAILEVEFNRDND